jgi:photosystem II stability/assembly factor-like uncharacterized protein
MRRFSTGTGIIGILLVVIAPTRGIHAQWTPTDTLQGGPITAFVSTAGKLFVGTSAGGVYRSGNLGTPWTAVNNGLANHAVLSLAVLGDTLYTATNGDGVFFSTDAGDHWTVTSDGLTNLIVQSLAVDDEYLFAGTMGGIYVSEDAGVSWKDAGDGLSGVPVRVLDVDGQCIVAGTNGDGVSLSTDRGLSWNESNVGLSNTSMFSLTHIGTHLFAGTYGGMFSSPSAGMPWVPLELSVTIPTSFGRKEVEGDVFPGAGNSPQFGGRVLKPKTVYSLAALGSHLFVGTYGAGVFHSTDLGKTWSPFNEGLGNLSLYVLRVVGGNLFAGSFDGEVWWRSLATLVGVHEGETGPPMVSALFQNYPNPCNLSTTIHYALPRTSMVHLKVYSVTGELVTTLVHEEQRAGSHEVRFDAGNLASGTYFYQLLSGEFAETKRLLIIK